MSGFRDQLDSARKTYEDLRQEAEIRRAKSGLLRQVIEIVRVVRPSEWQQIADKLVRLSPGLCPGCSDLGMVRDQPCPRCRLGRTLALIAKRLPSPRIA